MTGVALAFVLGCGGEETPTPIQPVENPEQTLEDGLASLNSFSLSVDDDPGAQLIGDPALGELMNTLGVSVFNKVSDRVQRGVAKRMDLHGLTSDVHKAIRPLGLAVAEGAGTYARDVQDQSEPFPGWVMVDANNPSDGYVFRFGLDDDIAFRDENGMSVPVQGELRLLEIVINDAGTPGVPEDDVLTHVVTEIAASPDPAPAPTLVRMELNATFTSQSARVTIGSAQASNPGDANASFFGPVMVHFDMEFGQSTIDVVEQLYHSVDGYGMRAESSLAFDLQTETPRSADFVLSFGEAPHPASLPFRFAIGLSNFRVENFMEVADVNGSITYGGAPVATFAGDTTEVPVDLDGDGVDDDVCVNVNIKFADGSGESQNICEAVQSFDGELLPF